MIVRTIIDGYSLVVFAAVVVSWMNLPREHPLVALLNKVTEPLLRPIRAMLPSIGGLDFSPMVLLIGLQAIRRLLL